MIRWITESERLPEPIEEDGEMVLPWVLLYTPYYNATYTIGYYGSKGWRDSCDHFIPPGAVECWAELQPPATELT